MAEKVVIIQGSATDTPYVNKIVDALSGKYQIERRIASAHRTPDHLQRILSYYEDDPDRTIFITVAGLSDALSGTVAARYSGRVIACPPDFDQYGEAKAFSSAKTPKGVEVKFTRSPDEAAVLVPTIFASYNWDIARVVLNEAGKKRDMTILDDARLQGVEEPPMPFTVFRVGKTRDVYDPGDNTLLIKATDRVSAFDVVLPEMIPGKGKSLTDLSEYWFKKTTDTFPNHFIERIDDKTIRVKRARRIDIEWVVRGFLYGSLWRAYERGERCLYGIELPNGLTLASELPEPISTPTTKASTGHDMPITKDEAIARGLVKNSEEWDICESAVMDLYHFYKRNASQNNIIIPDFKAEIGIVDGKLMQIDEPPNHDSARIWAARFYKPGQKQEEHALDKEFLRQFLLENGYKGYGKPPHLPDVVIDQVARRCAGAASVIKGEETDVMNLGLKSVEEILKELYIH
jgi:phosphoribosylaminoimidazole-succinocarboxamide synthase